MRIYQLLAKYQANPHAFEKTPEFEYFINNRDLLTKADRFDFLYNKEGSEFDIIRACIIIQAIKNKEIIETEMSNIALQSGDIKDKSRLNLILKEKIVDLPYLMLDKAKVYVPIFNIPLNLIYTKNPEKLLNYPYNELKEDFAESVIDTFDVYGTSLYNSYFTRLVKIATNGKEVAFFNYDTNTIYIVNNQGRLDEEIHLFDKFIKKPHKSHMLERLRPVVDCYFYKTKVEFIESLYNNDFISDKLLAIIKKVN